MKLDLRALLQGSPCNLRHVRRFSTSRCHWPENVAEHSFYVCLYTLAICEWCQDSCVVKPDAGGALVRAVLHDMEEARSGDVVRPFKYSEPELKSNLDAAAAIACGQVMDELWGKDSLNACTWASTWACSKDDTQEGWIVRFADFLSVLSFALQEGQGAPVRLSLDTLRAAFDRFVCYQCDFIRPLVDEAGSLVKEVLADGGT